MADEIVVNEMGEENATPAEIIETEEVQNVEVEQVDAEPKAGAEESNKIVKDLEATVTAERRKRQEAEQKLAELTKPPEIMPEVAAKPRIQDFETHEDFFEALTDWKIEDRDRKTAIKTAETRQQSKAREVADNISNLHSAGRANHPDWDEVVNKDNLPISAAMRDAMLNLDEGQEVFYHLGRNPDLALSIARMSPIKQAIEIARLETKLHNKPVKQTTKAPEPIDPVGAKKAGARLSVNDLATRDPKEFIRQRNAGLI